VARLEHRRVLPGAGVHSPQAAEERAPAAQIVESGAVGVKLPEVAPLMVHPECLGSVDLSPLRLFAQHFEPGARSETRCPNFGRPKWMEALL
jgi:hypothetical protein